MNWWAEESHFNEWIGKLRKYPIYTKQKKEVVYDLRNLFVLHRCNTFADVGGGDGRIGRGKVLDFQTGVDITKDWSLQGIRKVFDVSFISLVFCVLNEEEVDKVIHQMMLHTRRYIYLYEEVYDESKPCGSKIDNAYGEKYTHNIENHIQKYAKRIIYRQNSVVNPGIWVKYLIELL